MAGRRASGRSSSIWRDGRRAHTPAPTRRISRSRAGPSRTRGLVALHGRSGAWRGKRRRHPGQGRARALRRYHLLFSGRGGPEWKAAAPRDDLDGCALGGRSRRCRRQRRSSFAHQQRRSRPSVRRVDDPEIAVDEAQPAGTVRARGAYLRISGLHQLAPDRALGGVAQQHVGALALPEPRRRPAAVAARQAGPRRPRAEVAAGDHPTRRRH